MYVFVSIYIMKWAFKDATDCMRSRQCVQKQRWNTKQNIIKYAVITTVDAFLSLWCCHCRHNNALAMVHAFRRRRVRHELCASIVFFFLINEILCNVKKKEKMLMKKKKKKKTRLHKYDGRRQQKIHKTYFVLRCFSR